MDPAGTARPGRDGRVPPCQHAVVVPTLLAVRDLAVSYASPRAGGDRLDLDDPRVLDGVSLDVGAGEVVAVLGGNGAGKTTLLRAVSGLLALHGGRVLGGTIDVAGRAMAGRPPAARVRAGVVHVLEGHRCFGSLTVEENLRAGAHGRRHRPEVVADRRRALELFPGLARRLDVAAGHLSGGEQQQLAVARALMAAPRLLLLDEPSLGLAPDLVAAVGTVVGRLATEGTGVLLVEQHVAMALEVADRALVLDRGRARPDGPGPGPPGEPAPEAPGAGAARPAPTAR